MADPNDTTDYYNGFISNIKTVLETYKSYIDYKTLFDTSDAFITQFPSITIEMDSANEYWKEMARRKTIEAVYHITWYYQQYNEDTLRTEIRKGLNKICNVLRENWVLNDYCPQLGAVVDSATPYIIDNGEELIAGGLIVLNCKKVITVIMA